MKNIFEPVKTFMVACDQTETGFTKLSDLYFNLITEELIHELLKEYDKKNIVGIADGIADSVWVVAGFAISLDINLDNIQSNVESWSKFNSKYKTETCAYIIDDILSVYTDMRFLYQTYTKHPKSYVQWYIEKYCSELISSIINLSEHLNVPFQEIYDEVTRSNMSKVSETGKVIKNEFGKVQKPDTYFPPNIESILKQRELS